MENVCSLMKQNVFLCADAGDSFEKQECQRIMSELAQMSCVIPGNSLTVGKLLGQGQVSRCLCANRVLCDPVVSCSSLVASTLANSWRKRAQ